ncbi:hypothetical protein HZC08_00650, partial [Candidatus Micrarchaeota archaeon]|nr:hypothetical protein [Candidatus Micrarchaeota archaeon]
YLSNSTQAYYALELSVKEKSQIASEEYKELEKEQVGLIDVPPNLGPIVVNFEGKKISERFSEIKKILDSANLEYSSAKAIFSSKKQDYLNASLRKILSAESQYGPISSGIKDLMQDSETTVSAKREEAVKEIKLFELESSGKAINPKAKSRYLEAKNLLETGDSYSILGPRYVNYEKSAAYARNALSLATSTEYINSTLEFAFVENLIRNAKIDGLPIDSEEEELKLLKGIDEPWALGELANIESSVLSKASFRYHNIEDERAELMELIQIAPDLFYEIDQFELYFSSGKINFASAIGNLKQMEESYFYVKKELEKETGKYVSARLIIALTDPDPITSLDERITHEIRFTVKNPTKYSAKDMKINLQTEENGYQASNQEFILDSKLMELTIPALNQYQTISGSAKKEIQPAVITDFSSQAKGNPDGTAVISELTEFNAERDLYLNHNSSSTFFRKGMHELKVESIFLDAYSLSFSNLVSKKVGTNYEVSYDIVINPSLGLGTLEVVVPEDGNSFSLLSYSGEKILKKQSLSNGYYLAQLSDLKIGKPVVLKAFYKVSNVSEYAEGTTLNATVESIQKIAEAKIGTAEQNFLTNKEKIERETLLDIFGKEYSELDSGLMGAEENGLSEILNSRKEKLNQTLSSISETKGSIEELKDLDKDWLGKTLSQYKKDSFSEYKKLKELAGTLDANDSLFTEFNSIYNKFLGSGEVEDAVQLSSELGRLKNELQGLDAEQDKRYENYSAEFKLLKTSITEALKPYSGYYLSAKGSDFESLFSLTPSDIAKEVDSLDEAIKKRSNNDLISSKIESLRSKLDRIESMRSFLKNESSAKLEAVKKIYTLKKNSLAKSQQEKALQGIEKAESLAQGGDYIGSLKASSAVLKILNSQSIQPEDYSIPILGLTALLLLGIVSIYIIRKRKPKKEDKGFIKLRSIS